MHACMSPNSATVTRTNDAQVLPNSWTNRMQLHSTKLAGHYCEQ